MATQTAMERTHAASEGLRHTKSGPEDRTKARDERNTWHAGDLHVVVGVDCLQLAIPCHAVREMLQMPGVSVVPGSPPFIRGVVNLRGEVLPMIDLRLRLGLPRYGADAQDFIRMMEERAEEHRQWLAELESSIRENRAFTLAMDPTQCTFGKWYAGFRTENAVLGALLRSFEDPHRQIHELAGKAQALVAAQRAGEAISLVENARGTLLARLLQLFGRVGSVIAETQREMAVVISLTGNRRVCISVDEVRAVEPVDVAGQTQDGHHSESEDPLVGPAIRRTQNQGLVSVLNVDHLLACMASRPQDTATAPVP